MVTMVTSCRDSYSMNTGFVSNCECNAQRWCVYPQEAQQSSNYSVSWFPSLKAKEEGRVATPADKLKKSGPAPHGSPARRPKKKSRERKSQHTSRNQHLLALALPTAGPNNTLITMPLWRCVYRQEAKQLEL